MLKKRTIIAGVLVVVLLGLALYFIYPVYHAQGVTPRCGFSRRAYAEKRIYASLGLSEEQKKLLEENRDRHREVVKALSVQMREKIDLIRQELQKEQFNTEEILKANNELKALQAQLLDERIESILAVRKILTPEQFRKFMIKTKEGGSHFRKKSEWLKE